MCIVWHDYACDFSIGCFSVIPRFYPCPLQCMIRQLPRWRVATVTIACQSSLGVTPPPTPRCSGERDFVGKVFVELSWLINLPVSRSPSTITLIPRSTQGIHKFRKFTLTQNNNFYQNSISKWKIGRYAITFNTTIIKLVSTTVRSLPPSRMVLSRTF